MFQPHLQLFLLCFNRPQYIADALNSLIQQNFDSFEVIVSDNSTTDDVHNFMLKTIYPKHIRYVRRLPSIHALDHTNLILTEVTAPFFMLFHDDDTLHPNAVRTMMAAFDKNQNIAAVAVNALIQNGQTLTKKRFNPFLKNDQFIKLPSELALHYIDPKLGHMPFPAYMYRTEKVKYLKLLHQQGKKHADVSFLIKVAEKNEIIWIAEPLMSYRVHRTNGSAKIDIKAIFSLYRFLRKLPKLDRNKLNIFKDKHYVLLIRQIVLSNKSLLRQWRYKIFFKHSFYFLVANIPLILKRTLKPFTRD